MNILFIAALPPPICGQSKASKVLLDALQKKNKVDIINLGKKNLKNGVVSIKRIFEILVILAQTWNKKHGNDIIYLSLAESFLGNIRDLFIYLILYKNLDKVFVHMLGGAGMKKTLESNTFRKKINIFFLRKIAGIIVEGSLNFDMFSKVTSEKKIHIVPNFAEDYLFLSDHEIKDKYSKNEPIKILYLSNLLNGKGYKELADAYIETSESIKHKVNIIYVGGFESNNDESDFLTKIKNYAGIKYIGKFIDGEEKRELYSKSHVFCLPTYYPFEGQPISILEAYATGCVVITTNHSGIPFIFSDKKNGFLVEKKSVLSLQQAIEEIVRHKNNLESIALNNRNEAIEKYRTLIYQNTILNIFNEFYENE